MTDGPVELPPFSTGLEELSHVELAALLLAFAGVAGRLERGRVAACYREAARRLLDLPVPAGPGPAS